MTGIQIYEKYNKQGGEYAQLLGTLLHNLGDRLMPLLEKAEREGKKLGVTPEPTDRNRDELTVQDVIFV